MELTVLLCIPTDRRDVIEQHNMLLLERLEKIHQQHVPRQFDVSHLSDEVLNAPRASNAGFRRKQQRQIERENEKLQTRLLQARSGTLSNKKLALDADKHRYLAEQISKVARRRKVRERCQALSDQQQVIPAPQAPAVMMAAHTRLQLFNDESYIQLYDQSAYEDASSNAYGLSGSKSLSRLDGKKPGSFATLPQIHQHEQNHYDQHEQHIQKKKAVVMSSSLPAAACSPTLTHTTKLISALDLPRGLRNTGNAK